MNHKRENGYLIDPVGISALSDRRRREDKNREKE